MENFDDLDPDPDPNNNRCGSTSLFFGIGHQLSNERRQKKDSFHFYTKNCVIKNKHRPALVKVAIFAGFYKDRYFTRSGLGLFLFTQFFF
jgi:hypothetical protein